MSSGRQQRVGSHGAQPIRDSECAIEAAAEASVAQRGGLVHDHVRRGLEDGIADGPGVMQVQRDRPRAEGVHSVRASG
jgi:hypothetical protein